MTSDQSHDMPGQGEEAEAGDLLPSKSLSSRLSSSAGKTQGMRKGRIEAESHVPLWLVTFTDVMALMLTFFVLLYAMASPKEEEWKEMTSAIDAGFTRFAGARMYQGSQDTVNIDKLDFSRALDLDYLHALVKDIIAKDESLQGVVLSVQDNELVMSLPENLLFEAGEAGVSIDGKRALFSLAGPLSRIRNRIEVSGHTGPRSSGGGASSEFSSSWDLSLSHAVSVAATLQDAGYGRPVRVHGTSSARYDELPASMEEEKRLSLSRRVDIVIMMDDGARHYLLQ